MFPSLEPLRRRNLFAKSHPQRTTTRKASVTELGEAQGSSILSEKGALFRPRTFLRNRCGLCRLHRAALMTAFGVRLAMGHSHHARADNAGCLQHSSNPQKV